MVKSHKKGIELPINTLVVVAIAVIILLAVAAFFMGVWTPSAGGMQALAAKNDACGKLMNIGCADASISDMEKIPFNYDYDGSGTTTDDNLFGYCQTQLRSSTDIKVDCKKMCGCQIGTKSSKTTSCISLGGGYTCETSSDCSPGTTRSETCTGSKVCCIKK